MIQSLNSRTSIRKYSDKQISDELLNSLLETAFKSSNTGNMQTYSVVVNRNNEVREKLAPLHFNQPAVKTAPVLLTFCADFNRFSKWCEMSNAKPCYDNFLSFISSMTDALIVAQTFAIAAEEAGLGICYFGTTNYNPQGIIDVLKLPKLVMPITTLTVGYSAEQPKQTDRLPIEGLIHNEVYNNEVDIKSLYNSKENLPEMLQFIKDNNKETLAQVFTDVRYTQATNDFGTKNMFEALKAQGFIND